MSSKFEVGWFDEKNEWALDSVSSEFHAWKFFIDKGFYPIEITDISTNEKWAKRIHFFQEELEKYPTGMLGIIVSNKE